MYGTLTTVAPLPKLTRTFKGCQANLESLLYYSVMVADGAQGALSNDVISGRPNHPFWTFMAHSLVEYDWNYVLPYIVIMFASGQWFETAVLEKYHVMLPRTTAAEDPSRENHGLYCLILDGRDPDSWVFFATGGRGGTWNDWDYAIFHLGQRPCFAIRLERRPRRGSVFVAGPWIGLETYQETRGACIPTTGRWVVE